VWAFFMPEGNHMTLPAAYVSLFAAFTAFTLQTGQVSIVAAFVVLVLAVLMPFAEKLEFVLYVCLPGQRQAIRQFFRARRDR
jgi:hypothetical protein